MTRDSNIIFDILDAVSGQGGNVQQAGDRAIDKLTTFSLSQETINWMGGWIVGGMIAAAIVLAVIHAWMSKVFRN